MEKSNGMLDSLVTTFVEVSLIITFGVALLVSKALSSSEHTRLDKSACNIIPEDYILSFSDLDKGLRIKYLDGKHYQMSPVVDAMLRRLEFDKEEFYLVEAGALDIPKLSLYRIVFNDGGVVIELGSADFYDIFFTHYSPDLVISKQSSSESDGRVTLRSEIGPSLEKYYRQEVNDWKAGSGQLNLFGSLPNPIGVSGIVIFESGEGSHIVLRHRAGHEVAANNTLEWSFAGLLEATRWLHTNEIPLEEFAMLEMEDEFLQYFPGLKDLSPEIRPLGMVFNPLYLFQPELFVVVVFKGVGGEAALGSNARGSKRFKVVRSNDLSNVFSSEKLKNLCLPGEVLLKKAGYL